MISSFGWVGIVLVATATWALCAFFSQLEPLPGGSLLAQLQLGRQGRKGGKKLTGKTKPPRKFSNKSKARKKGKGKCKTTKKIRLVEMIEVVTRVSKGLFSSKDVEGAVVGARPGSSKKKTLVTRADRNVNACKQYVNLPKDLDGRSKRHPEYDRYVELRARIEWEDITCKDSLAGHWVDWEYDHEAVDGRPDDLASREEEGFGSTSLKVKTVATRTNAKGWTRVVKFHLSSYGGDKFTVRAKLRSEDPMASGGPLETGRYQVWRRLWYAVTEMKKPKDRGGGTYQIPSGALTRVQRAFAKVFVELADSGQRKQHRFEENLDDDDERWAWADKKCTKKRAPWKLHFAVVNHAADVQQTRIALGNVTSSPYTAMGRDQRLRPYTFHGQDWCRSVHYRRKGETGWHTLPRSAVSLVPIPPSQTLRRIRVTFPRGTMVPSRRDVAEVSIWVLEADVAMGRGGANLHLLVCRGALDDEGYNARMLSRQIVDTCVHEVGHGFQLVYTQAWKRAAGPGNHCDHEDCVMWHYGGTGTNPEYHDESVSNPGCRTWMRRYCMTRATMSGQWGFPR